MTVASGPWRSSTWPIRHNVPHLVSLLPAGCQLCAVVKANGYGHGAVPAAKASLPAAPRLGVATAPEAEELRAAGLQAPSCLWPLTGAELARAVAAGADVVGMVGAVRRRSAQAGAASTSSTTPAWAAWVWTPPRRRALAAAAGGRASRRPHDPFRHCRRGRTGLLHRAVPAFSPWSPTSKDATRTCSAHSRQQCRYLARVAGALRHGALRHRHLRPLTVPPRPARSGCGPPCGSTSYLAGGPRSCSRATRSATAGDSSPSAPTRVAIVPIGYGDGIDRALTNRGEVLVAGRRCRSSGPSAWTSSRCCCPKAPGRAPGDEVVFIGASGGERILAEDVAAAARERSTTRSSATWAPRPCAVTSGAADVCGTKCCRRR